MKKILVLTTTYPLNEFDTQPRFVEYLSKHMAETHHITVLAPAIRGSKGKYDPHSNLEVIRFRYFLSAFETLCGGDGILENLKRSKCLVFLIPFMIIVQLFFTIRLCHSRKIDVIHAHWILPQGLVAVVASFFIRRVKILLTSHGGDLFALNGKFSTWLKMFVLNKVSHVTVVSKEMKSFCVDYLAISKAKISVASMGVDLMSLFTPKGNKEPHKLVFVGRLAEKKGVDVLINAMVRLKNQGTYCTLDIVGGGSRQKRYESLAIKVGLEERVHFHGAVRNDLVVKFLRMASIAIFPFKVASDGDQEGLGLTMVEAMGCDCLTIASDLPAVKDVIRDGWNGLLVGPDNAEALANKVIYALSDKCETEKLIANGRKSVVEQFDWPSVGRRYSQIIDQLCQESV